VQGQALAQPPVVTAKLTKLGNMQDQGKWRRENGDRVRLQVQADAKGLNFIKF